MPLPEAEVVSLGQEFYPFDEGARRDRLALIKTVLINHPHTPPLPIRFELQSGYKVDKNVDVITPFNLNLGYGRVSTTDFDPIKRVKANLEREEYLNRFFSVPRHSYIIPQTVLEDSSEVPGLLVDRIDNTGEVISDFDPRFRPYLELLRIELRFPIREATFLSQLRFETRPNYFDNGEMFFDNFYPADTGPLAEAESVSGAFHYYNGFDLMVPRNPALLKQITALVTTKSLGRTK